MSKPFTEMTKDEVWEEILQRTKVPSPEFTEEERKVIDYFFAGKTFKEAARPYKKRRSMRVRLSNGKEEYIYNDAGECADALGMTKNIVVTYASSNRMIKVGSLAGWKFEYIRNE